MFLKPESVKMMFPSQADFFIMPMQDQTLYDEVSQSSHFWNTAQNFYGLNLSCLAQEARDEKFRQPVLDCYDISMQ